MCETKGAPAVCLSRTREDCVRPAEMTERTRPVTCNTDDGLCKQQLIGVRVCVCCVSPGASVCVCVCLLPMIHAE